MGEKIEKNFYRLYDNYKTQLKRESELDMRTGSKSGDLARQIAQLAKRMTREERNNEPLGDQLLDRLNAVLDQGLDDIAHKSIEEADKIGPDVRDTLMDCYQLISEMSVRSVSPLSVREETGQAYAYQLIAIALVGDFSGADCTDGQLVSEMVQQSGVMPDGTCSFFDDKLFRPATMARIGFSQARMLTREMSGYMINSMSMPTLASLKERAREDDVASIGDDHIRFLLGMNAFRIEQGGENVEGDRSDERDMERFSEAVASLVESSSGARDVEMLGQDTMTRCVRFGIDFELNRRFECDCILFRDKAGSCATVTWSPESYGPIGDAAGSVIGAGAQTIPIGIIGEEGLVGVAIREMAPWEKSDAVIASLNDVIMSLGLGISRGMVH